MHDVNLPGSCTHRYKWAIPLAFLVYLAILAFTIWHHELWGDEIHSWNLAKGSNTYPDLIRNIRYEGHPPVWCSILWIITRFTHSLRYLQLVHFTIISIAVYVLMFRSPLATGLKLLIPFGYYFLFEYAVLSRNYSIALLIAFAMCTQLSSKKRKPHLFLYYLLLFLLSNTHILGIIMACSFHVYFLLQQQEQKTSQTTLLGQALIGVLVVIPSVYLILPPSDSQLNYQFWISRWTSEQLQVIASAPVKSLIPIAAWWNYHFWNTNFLLEPGGLQLRNIGLWITSAFLIALIIYLLRDNKKCLYLFLVNLLLTCIFALLFPLTSTRYVGFIYISFIAAVWLMHAEGRLSPRKIQIIILFLTVQIPGAFLAVVQDVRYQFSHAENVKTLVKEVPPGATMVSDYWCLNNIAAFMDKPAYCLELNTTLSYILWDKKLAAVMKTRRPYTNGTDRLFKEANINSVYLFSTNTIETIMQKDTAFNKTYLVELVDKREGAIEKYSDLYLYRVSTQP